MAIGWTLVGGLLRWPRQWARVLLVIAGYAYDAVRFARFGGWREDLESTRKYRIAKASHSLEKSMAYRDRRKGAGWNAARSIGQLLMQPTPLRDPMFAGVNGYHTLQRFLRLEADDTEEPPSGLNGVLPKLDMPPGVEGGVIEVSRSDLARGMLQSPEDFFLTRYTVRQFSEERVNRDLIARAVQLALKAPSACNRQPWHVYHLSDRAAISAALELQTGNRGFGHTIGDLLIICSDLRAFISGNERYQQWIDGGIFSMSLVLALHSLGVASCCLNWSKMIRDDVALRRRLAIKDEHTVILMLAVGYPLEKNLLCKSARRPLEEVYTEVSWRLEAVAQSSIRP